MEHAAAVAIDNHHPTYTGAIRISMAATMLLRTLIVHLTQQPRPTVALVAWRRDQHKKVRGDARNAAAVQQAWQEATEKLKAKIVADFKTEHHFAMQSLEKSLAGDS